MKTVLYLRVSTGEQSVDMQRENLLNAVAARGWEVDAEYADVVSGAKGSRVALDRMRKDIRAGKIGRVFCYKLDRLGRSLPDLVQMVDEMGRHGCALIVPEQGIDTDMANAAGRLQWQVLAAVAEFERSLIGERTKEGLSLARKRGKRLGRPKGSKGIPDSRRKEFERIIRENPKISLPKLSRLVGVSVGTAWNWKREMNVEAWRGADSPRGKE